METFIASKSTRELWEILQICNNDLKCCGKTASKFRNLIRRELLRRDPDAFTIRVNLTPTDDGALIWNFGAHHRAVTA